MANEKRLIDANALKALFDERYDHAFMQSHTRPNIAHWEGYSIGVNWGRNTIADAPTVDAVPVVHGRWLAVHDGWGCCSNCSRMDEVHEKATHCRFCGAKMDGGNEDG